MPGRLAITPSPVATSSRQDYIHKIFERQCEIALANLERMVAVMGETVQVVFLCGTDFGTQTSLFCSVKTFRSLYFPYYKLPWAISLLCRGRR